MHGFPYRLIALAAPYPGWNAVQVNEWKLFRFGLRMQEPHTRGWPNRLKPIERVGNSTLIYYFALVAQLGR
jgi:hypothetical protein